MANNRIGRISFSHVQAEAADEIHNRHQRLTQFVRHHGRELRDDAGTLHLREHLCIGLIGFLERIAFSYRGLKLCCTPLNQAVHSKRVNDQKHEESECGKDPFLIIRPQCGPICVIEIGVRPCF